MLAMAAVWRAIGNRSKTQIDQTRKTWADMAKNASTKATMETTCKQTMDATKASLAAYGCSF